MISGRALPLVGALAVVVGAVFFFSLAFSRGWIGPATRVAVGCAVGAGALALGWQSFRRRNHLFGTILSAIGLGVVGLANFAATQLYDVFPVQVGLALTLLAAVAAAAVAIRADAPVVAGLGVVSILAAPPVLHAPIDGVAVALLVVTLVGTTAIALHRSWFWLSSVAFWLSLGQIGWWIVGAAPDASAPDARPALLALAAFWALHALAAGGETVRLRSDRLSPTSATLMLANSAALVGFGFRILSGGDELLRGPFLFAVAAAHAALAWYLFRRQPRHPFGLLVAGTGVAALTMAVPVQFGGSTVPLAWSAEAAALAWVFAQLRSRFVLLMGAVIGALAVAYLLLITYPVADLTANVDPDRPLLNGDWLTVAFVALAAGVAWWSLRPRPLSGVASFAALALLAYGLPFELADVALACAWAGLAVAGAMAARAFRDTGLALGVGAAGLLAVGHLLWVEYPLPHLLDRRDEAHLLRWEALALALVVAAVAAIHAGLTDPDERALVATVGLGVAALAMPFEFSGVALIAVWAVLAALSLSWSGRHRDGPLLPALGVVWAAAIAHLLLFEYPLADAFRPRGQTFFLRTEALGLACVVGVAAVGHRFATRPDARAGMAIVGMTAVAVAMPFELSGPLLVCAWVVLWRGAAWMARARPLPRLEAAGLVVGGLALAHLLIVDYPLQRIANPTGAPPFWRWETVAFAAVLAGMVDLRRRSSDRTLRLAAVGGGVLLLGYVLPFELSGTALLLGWVLLLIPAAFLSTAGGDPPARPPGLDDSDRRRRWIGVTPALVLSVAAALHVVAFELASLEDAVFAHDGWPLLNRGALSTVAVVAVLTLAARITTRPALRELWVAAAIMTVAAQIPLQLAEAGSVAAWSLLAIMLSRLRRHLPELRPLLAGTAYLLGAGAAVVAFRDVATPSRLNVDVGVTIDRAVLSGASLALLGLVALALELRRVEPAPWRRALGVAAGALVVYALSIGVVDLFQTRVDDPSDIAALRKQAQVALSITWALVGVGAFAAGIVRGFGATASRDLADDRGARLVRLFGLALIGLVTAKVFAYDLAALDASYRVLSFVGLGVLLLLASYVYQRAVAPTLTPPD